MLLSGCGSSAEKAAFAVTDVPVLDELLPEPVGPERPAENTGKTEEGTKKIEFDRFTVELPASWEVMEENGTVYYHDAAGHAAYMFNSCGSDNGLDEQELLGRFSEALKHKGAHEVSQPSNSFTDPNGNEFTLAQLAYYEDGGAAVLQLAFCRAQNFYISFKGYTSDHSRHDLLLENLDAAAKTIVMDKLEDKITGKSFEVEEENCRIDLKDDGSFKITYDRGDEAEVTGTYRVFRGSNALEVLEQEEGIDPTPKLSYIRGSQIPFENYYAVVFTYDKVVRWGTKSNTKSYNVVCDGYDKNGKLEMYNHNTCISEKWQEAAKKKKSK